MRIIGGKFGGRNIQVPKGLPVRPTTDRTKEALFNILNNELDWSETQVLDLFAGTGNISLECLSRGAAFVTSVDQNAKCIAAIQASFAQLSITNARATRANVWQYVKQPPVSYGLIFMDPPYDMPRQNELIQQLYNGGWLADEGIMIVEHTSHTLFSSLPGFDFSRVYGSSTLSFFRHSG
ncbi:MAG: 16S rRNA (guanine(966)-N(2))-methyltransferase RsmD [Bacteroidia bacterium]|nr:16S rRNA (guanine(966)-N(2))-methyltransferase RsmD [Bacteroidia bacterium]